MTSPQSDGAVCEPAAPLRPFVARYGGSRARGLEPGIHTPTPSRHAHLIISLGSPINVIGMPSAIQCPASFTAFVCGLQDAPARVRLGTSIDVVHVFLKPFGVQALLGVPGSLLASRVYELSDVWGKRAAALVERLREASSWPARFAVLDDALLRALTPIQMPREVAWAWHQLARLHGCTSIEGLARGVGWSRRYFAERFRTDLGVTPKTAARIFRFERACQLIKAERPKLADVAVACGYNDQAHLTREWNLLAGCTPRAWIARELPFLQDYELPAPEDIG